MTTPSHFFEKLQKLQAWDIEWHTMHHIVYESTKLTSLPLLTTKKKTKEETACCVEAIIFYLAKIVGAMYPTQPLP